MAMRAQPTEWTVEMVRGLPDDGNRYEVVDGELYVTPAPSWTHQGAVLELALVVAPYVRDHAVGHAIVAPADVVFGPRNMVQPDLFVVPMVGGVAPRRWEDVGRLLLAVEVLSPATRRADTGDKRNLYQRKGVPEYWVVDVENRVVERWRPNDASPESVVDEIVWHPDAVAPPLTIDLRAYFARLASVGA